MLVRDQRVHRLSEAAGGLAHPHGSLDAWRLVIAARR
jgi:hypothetical protein